jgi:6-phosphogluconolactonase
MQRFHIYVVALAVGFVVGLASLYSAHAQAPAQQYLAYFGTYTNNTGSKGIYAYRFEPTSGRLTALGAVAETPSPAFLVAHPTGRFLYAANELQDGSLSAFAIDAPSGKLTLLNKVSSRGAAPCHVAIDRTGKFLLVANYGSGSVAAFPIQQDGRLGEATGFVQHKGSSVNPERQTGPHAHYISTSPDNRFVLTADLGLDQVLVYRFDAAKGTLSPNTPPFAKLQPGSGPRHLAFHSSGKYVFVNGELSATLTSFAFDSATGAMKEIQTVSTLPAGFTGTKSTAEVQVDRAGRFVYVSNRGHDSVAIFSIDAATGGLKPAGHLSTTGKTPRYFTLDPTGNYLFAGNQNSNTVAIFRVDAKSGQPAATPIQTLTDVPQAVSIVFVAAR